MADYYPLLARTVGKVDTTDPAERQEFYQCAQDALVNALRRRNPEISAASISLEQAALQRAIVRLDAELRLTALKPCLEAAADSIATSPQRRGADSSILRRLKPVAADGRSPHPPVKPNGAQSVWFSKIPGLLERPPHVAATRMLAPPEHGSRHPRHRPLRQILPAATVVIGFTVLGALILYFAAPSIVITSIAH
jgi:hypothetical protein